MLTGLDALTYAAPPLVIVFLGDKLISWFSKRQHIVSRSSAEVGFCSVANVVTESCWLCQLLAELQHPLQRASTVYYDNISAVNLFSNLVQHQCTKLVEIDLYFIRECVSFGEVRVVHIPTTVCRYIQ